MRAIDGDALKEQLQNLAYDDWNQGVSTSWADAYREVADMVDDMPTVEARKGMWIYGENDCQDGWFCSECRFFIPWDYDYYGKDGIDFIKDFLVCPHCKAEMVTYTGKKENIDEQTG